MSLQSLKHKIHFNDNLWGGQFHFTSEWQQLKAISTTSSALYLNIITTFFLTDVEHSVSAEHSL